jgi:hypothetical protein
MGDLLGERERVQRHAISTLDYFTAAINDVSAVDVSQDREMASF